MKKLNNSGFSHIFVLLFIVLGVATVGTFMLVSSQAADLKTRAPVNFKCKSGQFLVNAVPADYMPGSKNKSQAKKGHGLLCVSNPVGRMVVAGYNAETISYVLQCRSNQNFAYDDDNEDGTGYHSPWKIRSKSGGTGTNLKTYYCIPKNLINSFSDTGSRIAVMSNGKQEMSPIDSFQFKHLYVFKPGFAGIKKGCIGDTYKYTGCKPNYFFSYYHNGDEINRKK